MRYRAGNVGGKPMLPITAAASASLYYAGRHDDPVAKRALAFTLDRLDVEKAGNTRGGHFFYTIFYASQAIYLNGDAAWLPFFPTVRDQLLAMQRDDGGWEGDAVGTSYGTAIAIACLQLPYGYLPIFQR
jgi:hypothetical protein